LAKKAVFPAIILIAVSVLGYAYLQYEKMESWLGTPAGKGETVRVLDIPRGTGVRAALGMLIKAKVAAPTPYLKFITRIKELPEIQAGEYEFSDAQSPLEMIEQMAAGRVKLHQFTVPEGLRFTEIANIVEKAGFGKAADFIKLVSSKKTAEKFHIPAENLEGYLLPETYSFPRNATQLEIVEQMISGMNRLWGPKEEDQAHKLGLSRHQIMTLASIIEKEAALPEERPLVSSVYHNRLELKMPLQADPTIIYGLKNYNGNISKADIRNPHPWNTYVHTGLPKGPIANPGAASIKAALLPAETDYIFFVARNNGSHHFSSTLEEHNRMVQKYQINGEKAD